MKDEVQQDMPYTIVGHSSVGNPMLSIIMTAEGIKELAKRMNERDRVRFEEWKDLTNECQDVKHYSRITILRN